MKNTDNNLISGSYAELQLTNRQFAFARDLDGIRVIVTVNNDEMQQI